jgi:hypothetical protein
MKTLKLTLNKKWFDLIEQGIKTEEYREIKKYWAVRLCGTSKYHGNDKGLLPKDKTTYWNGFYPIRFKDFDLIEFTNGYNKKSPQITMECKGIEVGTGKTEWGAVADTQYFIIKLGREVGRQNC